MPPFSYHERAAVRPRRPALALGLALVLTASCGDSSQQPVDAGVDAEADAGWGTSACGNTAPTVEVGTGQRAFVALVEGDSVLIECGAQGGWHITARLRASGLNDSGLSYSALVEDEVDGTLYAMAMSSGATLNLFHEGDHCESDDLQVRFPDTLTPAMVDGKRVRLRATVTDGRGRSDEDVRVIVLDGSMADCGP